MPRAVRVCLLAAGLGLLVQLLFYDVGLGINLPLTVAAVLIAGWLARDHDRRRRPAAGLATAGTALALAAFVALRGDTTLLVLDTLGVVALVAAALASFAGYPVVQRSLAAAALLGARLAGWMLVGATAALASVRGRLPGGRVRSASGRLAPIMRGLLLAIPLVIGFGLLFASADAVFAELAGDLFDWQLDLGQLPGRGLTAAIAAWLAAGALASVAIGDQNGEEDTGAATAQRRRAWLGTTEAITVLVLLDLLFVIFVALQATYLFGGRDTLAATGLTYAEYARRGFFELLAVAFGVGGLILALEAFVARRSRVFVVAAIGLVIFTLVVLSSAFLRLRLYQDAYGWTELRFYVIAAIAWLAIGAAGAIGTLAFDRTGWLPHGMIALSVVFGLVFNIIGPVRFIAERNVERAIHPELVAPGGKNGLDVPYLASLGDDALAVLAEAIPDLPPPVAERVTGVVNHQVAEIEHDAGGAAWQAWNLSRERARDLVRR